MAAWPWNTGSLVMHEALGILLQHVAWSSDAQLICSLLRASKATASAAHALCRGQLPVQLSRHAPASFDAWLDRNLALLASLRLGIATPCVRRLPPGLLARLPAGLTALRGGLAVADVPDGLAALPRLRQLVTLELTIDDSTLAAQAQASRAAREPLALGELTRLTQLSIKARSAHVGAASAEAALASSPFVLDDADVLPASLRTLVLPAVASTEALATAKNLHSLTIASATSGAECMQRLAQRLPKLEQVHLHYLGQHTADAGAPAWPSLPLRTLVVACGLSAASLAHISGKALGLEELSLEMRVDEASHLIASLLPQLTSLKHLALTETDADPLVTNPDGMEAFVAEWWELDSRVHLFSEHHLFLKQEALHEYLPHVCLCDECMEDWHEYGQSDDCDRCSCDCCDCCGSDDWGMIDFPCC